jgi:4-phospho-D-threonate 3-dehydrogenase / 4-phospho-D-erythronate 3-dehydrogenase
MPTRKAIDNDFGVRPLIAMTMGDPAGIGPEIIIKCINDKTISSRIRPLIIGNFNAFKRVEHFNKLINRIIMIDETSQLSKIKFKSGDIGFIQSDTYNGITQPGITNKIAGRLSYLAVKRGIELAIDKKIDAVVTGPICKGSWRAAGIYFHGHTELIAKMTKNKRYSMMFISKLFRIILVTIHEPIRKVPKLLKITRVIDVCITGNETLKKFFKIRKPRLACAGLNPHAGENGLFGHEEKQIILPAIKKLNKMGVLVSGPFPADTLFNEQMFNKYDLFVCMYHDQGLIPFKMEAFYEGVNITAGLPIIRTSPDHGTAFSIAGQNIADHRSMREAILVAREMAINSTP